MPAELGGSQISALLESVPGIANVLRSPVADAMVNLVRAGAGVGPYNREDAEELIQYAVRRGLIGHGEGERVLAETAATGRRKKPPAPVRKAKVAKRPKGRPAKVKRVKKADKPKARKKTARVKRR